MASSGELRVRFANTRYRVLYQRSDNLVVLLHAFEKHTGAVPAADKRLAQKRMDDFKTRWTRSDVCGRGPRVKTHLLAAEEAIDGFI